MSETTLLSAKCDLEMQEKQCSKTKAILEDMQKKYECSIPASQKTKN